jgi:CRISPR-associated protein Csm3
MDRGFYGTITLKGKIKVLTGLHIGCQREVAEIGGVDNPIIKDPLTQLPYLPGSSLKGKLRALWEIYNNTLQPQNKRGRGDGKFFNRKSGKDTYIHACESYDKAINCPVCRLFGSSGHKNSLNCPSRVLVRDCHLTEEWRKRFESGEATTEIKHENAMDRVTASTNPRPQERIPPGVEFDFEIIYSIEDDKWREDVRNLLSAMKMLEDSYLGGSGSRGYGKVEFEFDGVVYKDRDYYTGGKDEVNLIDKKLSVKDVLNKFDKIFKEITI